jgi:hypothetical protein
MVRDDDYLTYFQNRWEESESFINCEHDTIFHPKAIKELENCPGEWCAFGVTTQAQCFVDGEVPTMALMKFGKEFIKKCPFIWGDMAATDPPLPVWNMCDSWLNNYTRAMGVVCHQHYPDVVNANPRYN